MSAWRLAVACWWVGVFAAWGQAILPTGYSGPWTNTALLPVGWSQIGLDCEYSSNYDGIDGNAVVFDSSSDMLTIFFSEAPGDVVCWIKGNSLSGSYVFKVLESTDGANWSDVVSYEGAGLPGSATAMTNALLSGSRYVRFHYVNKDYGNIGLDGVSVSAAAPTNFAVTLDPSNAFSVAAGEGGGVAAQGWNGEEPYLYQWSSSLDSAHWTTNEEHFSILSSAPTGYYFATVLATDASESGQTVSNTVYFSVLNQYQISILPLFNGQIVTDPAVEAIEGETVSILATPDPGFQIAGLSVMDAETNSIAVTNATFIMPASAVTVTGLFETYVMPDVWVDFEDYTGTYASNNYEAVGMIWGMTNIYRGNTADDRKNGLKAGRFQHDRAGPETPAVMKSGVFADSIQKITLWYANYGVNDGGAFQVQVSDDGLTWQDVGTIYDPDSTVLEQAVIDGIPSNMTYMQILTTSGDEQRVNIDDIEVYFVNPVFRADLDRTNEFRVVQGSNQTIRAWAVNGTFPYSYEWSSSLNSGHFTVSNNAFTVSATAPTGTYTATVVATDTSSPAQQTTNSVTFIVPVSPGTIVITPPAHGTVTTDPALEAEEGERVYITAVPDAGCQFLSANVMDSDGVYLGVISNTFTMPSKGVIISAFFEEPVPAGSYVVDFEDASKSLYASATVSLSGKDWDMSGALIGTAPDDLISGSQTARLRDYDIQTSLAMLEDWTNGLGRLSFKYRQYLTHSQVPWRVVLSVDGGTNWVQLGDEFTAPSNQTVQLFSETANVLGNVRVRIESVSTNLYETTGLNLDDIVLTPFDIAIDDVVFDPVDGHIGFPVPAGYLLSQVMGADLRLAEGGWAWSNLTEGIHYSISNAVVTILTAPESRQVIRMGVTSEP